MPRRLWPSSKPCSNASSTKSEPPEGDRPGRSDMPEEIDVKYVAHLARLSLTPEEEQKLGGQLQSILGYVEKLKQVDVTGVEPTAHAFPMVNVCRPDEVQPSLKHEEALRNAPAQANGLFIVPKIVE
jgi:aspartyl-tRNA(Asn)/glutamyl-tRNA(Gln) amidotransferase subunit C